MLAVLPAIDEVLVEESADLEGVSGVDAPRSDHIRPEGHLRAVRWPSPRRWVRRPVRVEVQVVERRDLACLDVAGDRLLGLDDDVVLGDEEPVAVRLHQVDEDPVLTPGDAAVILVDADGDDVEDRSQMGVDPGHYEVEVILALRDSDYSEADSHVSLLA